MQKILFTDLYDTLINEKKGTSREYYNSIEKEREIIARYINKFLKDGNSLAIVTSPNGHGNFGRIFNEDLTTLNNLFAKYPDSKVAFYLQGNGRISPNDEIEEKKINGRKCYLGKNGMVGIHISKKEDAVSDFLYDIKMPYQIYALGDSMKDIPMLLKAQEFGGNSAFIDMHMFRDNPVTINELIDEVSFLEIVYELRKINDERKNWDDEKEEEELFEKQRPILIKREERKQELYQLLLNGDLDLVELNKKMNILRICSNYQDFSSPVFSKNDKFWENYPISEELIQNVVNMPTYPTFGDYYSKVLKR